MTGPSDVNRVDILRSPRALQVVTGVSFLLFGAMALILHETHGWAPITVAACGLWLLGLAGVVDSLTARVELRDESIVIVRNLRRREYPRRLFVKASWAKGAPVALQTDAGRWIRLPTVTLSSQGMRNKLRAWIAG